ncbi:MAG TPA: WXG100 family type VII secretion target [Jatrophihabitans sp.]|jgi:WXG100 family type VII secretion target
MSEFDVLVPEVGRAAATADNAGADLLAEIDRVRREAEDVLAGRWRGAVARRFERAWSQWDADARAVVRALDELAESLRLAARDYSTQDLAAADGLRLAAAR